jgi:ATP-dependent DNA helicase DinG
MPDDPIKKFFPYPEYRAHQRQNIIDIIKAFSDGKTSVIYDAPTGSGKSVVGMTVANILNTCYYLTTHRNLQTQIINEFGNSIVELKGRSNYPCYFMNDHLKAKKYFGADRGKCIQKGKAFLDFCLGRGVCAYKNQLDAAEKADKTLFNFSSFLYQREMADRFTEPRKLLIIDECDGAEQQIMSFVDVTIKGEDVGETLPEFDSVDLYMSYFESIQLSNTLHQKLDKVRGELSDLVGPDETSTAGLSKEDADLVAGFIKDIEKYESMLRRYNYLKSYVSEVRCVCDFDKEKNSVSIKPLYANYHTPRLLLTGGHKHLLMSATIFGPKVLGKSLGLDMSKTAYIKVPHTFPRENRLIHLDYAGSMTYKDKNATMPRLISKIDSIMDKHVEDQGIIHCQSFWLMDAIVDGVSVKNRDRLIHQKMFKDKDEMLQIHAMSKASVIIAPAMHSGIDLKNELSRFQIISKIPWPSAVGNKQMEVRIKEDWTWYLWLTACKLIQSTGRSIRSETDYASTYILDSNFDSFFNQCDKIGLIPDWFIEALVID